MSSRQQMVRQPGSHQPGKRCPPARNVQDSLVAIYQERDALQPAMCTTDWWPSTRKEMSFRQQCVRQSGGHQIGNRCPPSSIVYNSLVAINQEINVLPRAMCTIARWSSVKIEMLCHQQCVIQLGGHLLGKSCSLASNVYDSLVAINQESDVIPPANGTIAWWPSTRKVMFSRQQYLGQLGGHQLGKRCPPASNVYDTLVAISQDRDALPQAMCRIAWWSSTRQEMSSRQQLVRQPVDHQLGKRYPPASNMYDSLVGINQERDALPPAMCTIALWPSTTKEMSIRKQYYDSLMAVYQERDVLPKAMCTLAWWPSTRTVISSRQQMVRQPGGHQLGN